MINLASCVLVAVTSATVNPRSVEYEGNRIVFQGAASRVYWCGDQVARDFHSKPLIRVVTDKRGNRQLVLFGNDNK